MSEKVAQSGVRHVVARRVLTESGLGKRKVTISIGAPRRHPQVDWECPFLIDGIGDSRVQKAGGVDALQALLMAIEGVRVTLERTGRRLVWLDPEVGPDIPRYIPTVYGRHFEHRINLVIEREMKRAWEAKLKSRKADIATCEAELKQRKEAIAALEAELGKRKAAAAAWESNLKTSKKRPPAAARDHLAR